MYCIILYHITLYYIPPGPLGLFGRGPPGVAVPTPRLGIHRDMLTASTRKSTRHIALLLIKFGLTAAAGTNTFCYSKLAAMECTDLF